MHAKIHVGTSGWSYKHWVGVFYPEDITSKAWLEFYTHHFSCTEINASFYRIPKKETVEKWVRTVPEDFFFCPKLSRYITHLKRLHDPEEPLNYFFSVFEPMREKMGPVLVQLPPSLKFNREVVEHFFDVLKKKYHHYTFAVEGRHPSWLEEESIQLLKEYEIAFVISQSGNHFPYGEFVTAKNIYLRFHGPEQLFSSPYDKTTLQRFARKMKSWRDDGHHVWAFFNNDVGAHALTNGRQLIEMTKVPSKKISRGTPTRRTKSKKIKQR